MGLPPPKAATSAREHLAEILPDRGDTPLHQFRHVVSGGTDGLLGTDWSISEVVVATALILTGALIWTDVLACSCDVPAHAEAGVREQLAANLAEAGVAALTPIQLGVLPHCLAGADVLAKAKTGTGKTFAFLVPTVERLLRSNDGGAVPPVRGRASRSPRAHAPSRPPPPRRAAGAQSAS